MELELGSLLHGRYRIQGTLGKGGMGAVYTALDESLGVPVAVKENLLEDDKAIEQFRREAIILAGLRHPNLPRVTDHFVIPDQGQYLVMDFIEGEDLKDRLQRLGELPEKEVTLIGVAIADALNYLHSLTPPVLHRDIKPGNIRVTPNGQVFLVDFGLAKQVEGGEMTATGARGLTPGYSPPEQYGTARTDGRTDIYALGATLYTALTGFPPEDGLAVAIKQTELTPVRTRKKEVSPQIAAVIEKALSVNADDRYQTGREFKRALLQASDTVNRQVARGDITVEPPPADATVVAGEATMPSAKLPLPSAEMPETLQAGAPTIAPPATPPVSRPTAPPAAKKKNLVPWLVIGGVIVVGMIVVGFLLLSGLLGGEDGATPVAEAATDTLSAAVDTDMPTDTVEALAATNTAAPTEAGEDPMPTESGEPSPQPTEAPAPAATQIGGSGMVAFASDRTGEVQIYLADVSGEVTQLTDLQGGACQPTWSPDGMRLAFIAPCGQNQQRYDGASLFMINVNGTNLTPLKSSPIGDYDPAWSPVDNRIAFTTIRDFNRPQIWILDIDTDETVNISDNVTTDYQPAWSPDGSKILFASNRVISRGKLWVMDANGQNVVELSREDSKTNIDPVWGPDGDMILFSQYDSNGGGIPKILGTNWHDGSS
ncbi:MAG: protein kinase, partial [Anaerolineales bacterium]